MSSKDCVEGALLGDGFGKDVCLSTLKRKMFSEALIESDVGTLNLHSQSLGE